MSESNTSLKRGQQQGDSPGQYAYHAGVSESSIRRWMKLGHLDGCYYKSGRIRRDLADAKLREPGMPLHQKVTHDQLPISDDVEAESAGQIRIRYESSRADIMEYKARQLSGELMPVREAEETCGAVGRFCLEALDVMERDLPQEIVICDDILTARELVRKYVDDARQQIADKIRGYADGYSRYDE